VNVTIHLEKQPQHADPREFLKRTACIDGLEWDIQERLRSLTVRCGPYDNSDMIVIEQDLETHEFRVLYHGAGPEMPECVLSVMEEQP
jgi:hypothetical protein